MLPTAYLCDDMVDDRQECKQRKEAESESSFATSFRGANSLHHALPTEYLCDDAVSRSANRGRKRRAKAVLLPLGEEQTPYVTRCIPHICVMMSSTGASTEEGRVSKSSFAASLRRANSLCHTLPTAYLCDIIDKSANRGMTRRVKQLCRLFERSELCTSRVAYHIFV